MSSRVRVLFRSRRLFQTRTARTVTFTFALASGPFIVLGLASLLRDPQQPRLIPSDPNTVKVLEERIQATMADSKLDLAQKDRISKGMFALIDMNVAMNDSHQHFKKLQAALKRARDLDATTKAKSCKCTMAELYQEQLDSDKESSRLLWQASKLFLFAPLGDVEFAERVIKPDHAPLELLLSLPERTSQRDLPSNRDTFPSKIKMNGLSSITKTKSELPWQTPGWTMPRSTVSRCEISQQST